METSDIDNDPQRILKSPPPRRRSTFFERRDSIVSQPLSENVQDEAKNDLEEGNKCNQELERYYELLKGEKEQWQKEVNRRRNEYHDLRLQYQIAAKGSSRARLNYSVLNSEDMEFLKAKVNISKLVESQQKLQKSVKLTQALYRRALELDDVVLRTCEDKVKQITDYILDNSTIDSV
ncbi:uncharacterized protein LOC123705637 isoform X2 [Colias croceus]|uniref:uncharacterized protein LOC123705637 isoform X2 n=1 Tax=Colias crocea TaxID=72248 RepID=UPI001E27D909|nr:uncharacterized protein LOC123705637 isoform X2 [Colias croceus]